ncbi:GTP cyclohydrolase FolE2 [beta proteobacterium MWH-UniP1]
MNASDKLFSNAALPDVQSHADTRQLAIQRVGVKSLVHPVVVQTAKGPQPSVATIDMTVALPPEVKGTHMSRFLEVFQNHQEPLGYYTLQSLMDKMLTRLESGRGYIKIALPYFVTKAAPVSGVESLMDYQVTWECEVLQTTRTTTVTVVVPVTSLCPCSKKISQYGAHNQRSHVTIAAQISGPVEVEDLIRVAEQAASCELWGLLKRPDEKYVTERAYDNPKFVEDLVRDIALALSADHRIQGYSVESENFESIHNHSAYAKIDHLCHT